MLRIIISVFGAAILFYLSFTINGKIQEIWHIDKILHMAMMIFLGLFLSVFFHGRMTIFVVAMIVGIVWECYQFYGAFAGAEGSFLAIENTGSFLLDSRGDLAANFVGLILFNWWIYPQLV